MLIYVMDERKTLDTDSIKNNKKLKELIELRLNYKIPFLILLTHSDNYADELRKAEKDWKNIWEKNINRNTKELIAYINNDLINKEYNSEFKIKEEDILHINLVEPNQNQLTDKDLINLLDEDSRKEYDEADENNKKMILKFFAKGHKSNENELNNFIKGTKVLGPKKLIEKMKEKFPVQFHSAFIEIK